MKMISARPASIAPILRSDIPALVGGLLEAAVHCESAMRGRKVLEHRLSEREISLISVARFSIGGIRGAHELQVVDDEAEPPYSRQRRRARERSSAEFERGPSRRMRMAPVQLAERGADAIPVARVEASGAKALRVHAGNDPASQASCAPPFPWRRRDGELQLEPTCSATLSEKPCCA